MILFGSEPMNCRFVCMSDDKISLSTSLLSQLFTGDKPWTGTFSEIFINFDRNYQIANTCDWFGHIGSPHNAILVEVKMRGPDQGLGLIPASKK